MAGYTPPHDTDRFQVAIAISLAWDSHYSAQLTDILALLKHVSMHYLLGHIQTGNEVEQPGVPALKHQSQVNCKTQTKYIC